ncbi:MAG: ribosome biogenesis GTPase Der [Deltaproteobacteria bacterium]|jgi:GTPase|nr:ribosome biogenesis GTPase Der [Deltaproteobacteria bacterium]
MHPIVAIVGRPNVGKSRLFNRMVGSGKAIVADIPGVTRDRHYAEADWCGREYICIDTGGLDLALDPNADLEGHITRQSLMAAEEADVIICLFDGQLEPTPIDHQVVEELRKVGKPIIFAVNKVDDPDQGDKLIPYYEFGVEKIVAVSAEHGIGVDDLLDEALLHFPPEIEVELEKSDITVAVIGRPNVGKSTLVNRLAGEERVVSHEKAGTTRDAVNVEIDFEGKKYLFIDTAGVKRRWSVSERLERLTAMRSLRMIDRAEIIIQLIDGSEGLTKQDLSLAGFIRQQGKGSILVVNKWDLMEAEWQEYERRLREGLGDLKDIPILCISAVTGQNCLKVLSGIEKMHVALGKEIPTSDLNRIMELALEGHHLPVFRGKQVRIKYATQIGTYPPTIALFSNYPAAVPYAYRKYLMRKIMEALGVKGIPLKIVCKRK